MSASKTKPGALHRALATQGRGQPQMVVFFEIPWDAVTTMDVGSWLQILLAAMWDVPPDAVQLNGITRERPLLSDAIGGEATGDLRLFETSQWHGPIYAEPERTLLLVCPATLARLVAAQRRLPIVDASTSMPAAL